MATERAPFDNWLLVRNNTLLGGAVERRGKGDWLGLEEEEEEEEERREKMIMKTMLKVITYMFCMLQVWNAYSRKNLVSVDLSETALVLHQYMATKGSKKESHLYRGK